MAKPDVVAELHALSSAIEDKIRERDRLLKVVLQLEATGAAPDYSALKAVQTITAVGLLNGKMPEGAAEEVRLAWALNRRSLLATEIERDRGTETGLRHDAADILGADELTEWNAQLKAHTALLARLEASQKKLGEIDARWVKKTGGVRDLPMRAYIVQDYTDAVAARRDELLSLARAANSRGDEDARPMTKANEPHPPEKRW
jgi:hypothetical protein